MAPSLFFMGIIILVGLALIVIPDEANRRTQYEIETYRAISANNIIRARNCLENLIQISGENPKPEYLYQLEASRLNPIENVEEPTQKAQMNLQFSSQNKQ